jgi:hypothetical protein
MPTENSINQYRIRSLLDAHERMIREVEHRGSATFMIRRMDTQNVPIRVSRKTVQYMATLHLKPASARR